MHLQKLPDGSIRLTRLNPWDVQTFRSLPVLTDYTQDPNAEKRLLPTPAIDSDMSPELAMDWVEYVLPELRESFAGNLAVVMSDIATLTEDFSSGDEGDGIEDDEDDSDDDEESGEEVLDDGGGEEDPDDNNSTEGESTVPEVPHYTLTIPADHVEAWFRTMNQARIVLSVRYGIDSEHVPELAKLLEAGQIEYWFQYELFVSLQGWLVEAVLDPE